MPVCKYCHARISKFDKDICPVCGQKDPLSGVTSDTIDITTEIDMSEQGFSRKVPCTKKRLFKLFAFIGWTGSPFFYMRCKPYIGILWLILNLGIIGGVGSVFMFLTPLTFWGYIIMLAASYLINIIVGLIYTKVVNNLKDGQGELIL